MDDTISKDPKRIAEAKRMAADENKKQAVAASLPKLPFDPKAVAREEFERNMDPRFFTDRFEEVWGSLEKAGLQCSDSEIITPLTEMEFRDNVASYYASLTAAFLRTQVEKQDERAATLGKAAQLRINDRVKWDGTGMMDLAHGVLRKVPSGLRTCLAHPNGCPDGSTIGDFVKSLFDKFR